MLQDHNGQNNDQGIYEKIRRFVQKLIKRRVQNPHDADDITQNTLVKVYSRELNDTNLLKFESEEDVKKYFTRVAINETNRYFTNRKNNKEINNLDEIENNREGNQIKMDICFEYLELFYGMSIKQKLSIILKEKEILQTFKGCYSIKTISQILEINENDLMEIEKEIPVETDEEAKIIIERLMKKELKTKVRDERYKGRKYLDKKRNLNKD
ncbi:MAG TPA: sigma factor [Pyrinomonadaceae bacterium]|nr:sigma factor [Pyrinomonadaceae bacterium]